MEIYIQQYESRDTYGRIACVQVETRITHSPSEGFDNEKLGQLETDLADFLTKRINDAIKRGGAA